MALKASSNGFLWTTRNQVLARLTSSEPAFLISCVDLIAQRNGWMASHKTRAAKLVARLAAGTPSPEDLAEAVQLMTPYARTLSRILREREIAERPELAMQAATFGVVRSPTVPDATAARLESTPVVTSATTEVAAEAPVVKRRRGRPPGSKSKPRTEPEQSRRRRRS